MQTCSKSAHGVHGMDFIIVVEALLMTTMTPRRKDSLCTGSSRTPLSVIHVSTRALDGAGKIFARGCCVSDGSHVLFILVGLGLGFLIDIFHAYLPVFSLVRTDAR